MLRIKNKSGFVFAPREVAGASSLDGHFPSYLVLDYQQRLTSLYQALYGTDSHRHFMNLAGLLDSEDVYECVFSMCRRGAKGRFDTVGEQSSPTCVPVARLLTPRGPVLKLSGRAAATVRGEGRRRDGVAETVVHASPHVPLAGPAARVYAKIANYGADSRMTLGERIREARIDLGLKLRPFAQKLGISPTHQSDIENDRRVPSEELLREIAQELRLDFDELMGLTGRLGDKAKRYAQEEPAAAALFRKLSEKKADKAIIERLDAQLDALTKGKKR